MVGFPVELGMESLGDVLDLGIGAERVDRFVVDRGLLGDRVDAAVGVHEIGAKCVQKLIAPVNDAAPEVHELFGPRLDHRLWGRTRSLFVLAQHLVPLLPRPAIFHQVVHVHRTRLTQDIVQEPAPFARPLGGERVVFRREHHDGEHPDDLRQAFEGGAVHEYLLALARHVHDANARFRRTDALEQPFDFEVRGVLPNDVAVVGGREALRQAHVMDRLQHVRLPHAIGPVQEIDLRSQP